MPGFSKDTLRTPFGRNQYLRSTRDMKLESYTCAKDSVPGITIDGTTQKIWQPGTAVARILTGADAGKVGPYRGGGATNEIVSITVDAGGGTFTATWSAATSAAIAYNASPQAVRAALVAAWPLGANDLIVTGGPGVAGGATPYVLEFTGAYGGENVGAVTTSAVSLTGGAGTAVVAVTTAGAAGDSGGATDGRGDSANIVGLNNTFLPWQFLERDVEIAVLYEGAVVQGWCFELNAAGTAYVPLTNATAEAMRQSKICSFLFK